MPNAIHLSGLTKKFGNKTAVSDLELFIETGETFGFLGPNGAGKTTTIRMMLGLAARNSGSIVILEQPVPQGLSRLRFKLGALPEPPTFYPHVTGIANLRLLYLTSGRGLPQNRIENLLDRVGLSDVAGKRVGGYSHGMRQRLGIAAALLHDPELLILDEPLTGLDPDGVRDVRELIKSLCQQGKTIFLSSHVLSEVQQVCTNVAFLKSGTLVGTFNIRDELRKAQRVIVVIETIADATTVLRNRGWQVSNEHDHLVVDGADRDDVRDAIVSAGLNPVKVSQERRNLEDLYVELTAR